MDSIRAANVFGAVALTVADDIVRGTGAEAPEAGPAASAIALLGHEPGLSVVELAAGVGLSHPGTVRLVDRLAATGMVERRAHGSDGRARALHLTAAGREACGDILAARRKVLARGLAGLSPDELEQLGRLSERVLRAVLTGEAHALRICRLCDYDGCTACPIDDELTARAEAS